MNNRFENYIESASTSKQTFNRSVEGIKESLQASVKSAHSYVAPATTTGWLKGSLSYPWVLVCSLVPAIKELF